MLPRPSHHAVHDMHCVLTDSTRAHTRSHRAPGYGSGVAGRGRANPYDDALDDTPAPTSTLASRTSRR
jgi:hypothetical protein